MIIENKEETEEICQEMKKREVTSSTNAEFEEHLKKEVVKCIEVEKVAVVSQEDKRKLRLSKAERHKFE